MKQAVERVGLADFAQPRDGRIDGRGEMPAAFVGWIQFRCFDGLGQIGERVNHQGNVTLLLEDLRRKAVFDGPNGQVGVEPDTRNDGKHGQRKSDGRPGHIKAA